MQDRKDRKKKKYRKTDKEKDRSNKIWQVLFKLKSRDNQWKWRWSCIPINLYYNYIKHTKDFRKGSGWIIDSVIDHTISISNYNPLVGSIYIKLPKELDHPRKGLINTQNMNDNKCFK